MKFTVRPMMGTQFPFDMLRYDICYPADPESASRMGYDRTSRKRFSAKEQEIELITQKHGPTVGRWNSFGWEVIRID